MIQKKDIARIKIAQKDAGLDDGIYRTILQECAGVSSCTSPEFNPDTVQAVIEAIKKRAANTTGWKRRQQKKFLQYASLAGLSLANARLFLSKTFNSITYESSQKLSQEDFDLAMAEIEGLLEQNIESGGVPRPQDIELAYWRNRYDKAQNGRGTYKIRRLWSDLQTFLDEDRRTTAYLNGIARNATGHDVANIATLDSKDTWLTIEAIKGRIAQEQHKLQNEVPF